MTKLPRVNRSPAFKVKMALDAVKGERALAESAQRFDVVPNLITAVAHMAHRGASGVFGSASALANSVVDGKVLHAKIG